MARWLLALTLAVATSTASAQAGRSMHLSAATDLAEAAAKNAEHRVAQLASHRAELDNRYHDECDAIDRLKRQRPSWRLDRELRDSLSSSAETANQLAIAARELDKANAKLLSARRAYLVAIDAERSAGVAPLRAAQLERVRRLLEPQVKESPRPIVFPDLEVDPLADPEELDQRAVELRASEDLLSRQLAGLAAQVADLDRLVRSRKQHERAGYLLGPDDDRPYRDTAARRARDSGPRPDDGTSQGGQRVPGPPGSPPGFASSVTIVLSNVIDASTISAFAAAQRSGDPAQLARAARRTHGAVAQRLAQVRRKRTEIEARAKQLRDER